MSYTFSPLILCHPTGYLSDPVQKYDVFGGNLLLIQFPYFLASVVTAAIFLLTYIIILFKWDNSCSERKYVGLRIYTNIHKRLPPERKMQPVPYLEFLYITTVYRKVVVIPRLVHT